MKFFKRLLLHRIDWNSNRKRKSTEPMLTETDGLDSSGGCKLVWEGTTADHVFPKWSIREVRNDLEARKHFVDRGVEEYWDLALAKAREE